MSVSTTTLLSTCTGATSPCPRTPGPYWSRPDASTTHASSMCDVSICDALRLARLADEVHQVVGQGAEMTLPLVDQDQIVVEIDFADGELHELTALQLLGDRHAEDRGETHAKMDELLGRLDGDLHEDVDA